jgi:hypothetical protein
MRTTGWVRWVRFLGGTSENFHKLLIARVGLIFKMGSFGNFCFLREAFPLRKTFFHPAISSNYQQYSAIFGNILQGGEMVRGSPSIFLFFYPDLVGFSRI